SHVAWNPRGPAIRQVNLGSASDLEDYQYPATTSILTIPSVPCPAHDRPHSFSHSRRARLSRQVASLLIRSSSSWGHKWEIPSQQPLPLCGEAKLDTLL
ncbi:hypothetical protein T310_9465, partial [Rasamsonia emersonii CBS 393.64]